MSVTVQFRNVGRDKKSWTSVIPALTHAALVSAIRRQSALMSREIEFIVDGDEKGGRILVGGCRRVGEFEIGALGAAVER